MEKLNPCLREYTGRRKHQPPASFSETTMKPETGKHVYVPPQYEISTDFDFDLHLSFSDYLFLLCYAVPACAFLLASGLAKVLTGKSRRQPKRALPRYADGRIYLFISKFF